MDFKAEELAEKFEIVSVSEWINQNKFSNILLHYTNDLHNYSVGKLIEKLKDTDGTIYNNYQFKNSECCADVLLRRRLNVDAVVHFGYACLTPFDDHIHIRYVHLYPTVSEDTVNSYVKMISENLQQNNTNCITLLYEFRLQIVSNMIRDKLTDMGVCVHYSEPKWDYKIDVKEQNNCISQRIIHHKCLSDKFISGIVVYVSHEYDIRVQSNMIPYYYSQCPLYCLSVMHDKLDNITIKMKQMLMRRMKHIQTAKDAQVMGILQLNDTHKDRKEFNDYLGKCMRLIGGKQVFNYRNRLPVNMNSIPGLDAIVYITCADSCLDYAYREAVYDHGCNYPMVTPMEMLCACLPDKFDNNLLVNRYITDISEFLSDEYKVDLEKYHIDHITESDDDGVVFSLNSGRIYQKLSTKTESCTGDQVMSLVPRLDTDLVLSKIQRDTQSYFGLDPQVGETKIGVIEKGLSGIASNYVTEPKKE